MRNTRNTIDKGTGLATFATVTVAALITFGITSGALAGKPGGTTPTYSYIRLGTLGMGAGYATAINQAGLVVGYVAYYVDNYQARRAFVVVPRDTNHDGKPDLWFEDQNQDGLNDLQFHLGWPPGFTPADFDFLQATDINDRGQILMVMRTRPNSGRKAFVLTPADVNEDGKVEFFEDDGTGANALLKRLPLESVVMNPWSAAIDNLGQVAGYEVGGNSMGFVLAGQDTDGDGMADTWFADVNADSVNDLVQTLGYAWDSVNNGPAPISPADINDQGHIAGSAGYVPYLIRPRAGSSGKVWWADDNGDGLNDLALQLPILSGGQRWGQANGINAAGKVVGASTIGRKGDTCLAVLWQSGAGGVQTTQLAALPGEKYNIATAINAQDVVVGYSGQYRAFVWQNGVTKELRLLTDQADALAGTWMTAWDINDMGAIIGSTEYPGPAADPFIAVPKSMLP